MLDCTIVIVNYNTSDLIINLLESIEEYCRKYVYEIIVVDNNSQKENPSRIKDRFQDIRLIKLPSNDGFGVANNVGIKEAKGDYILLLNSDTLMIEPALDACIDFMKSDEAISKNIGVLGCKLLNEDRSHQESVFDDYNLLRYLLTSNVLLDRLVNKKHQVKGSKFVQAVSGAFMMFRKEVFEKVKPFDPDIFMYSEETELCRSRVMKYFNIYYWEGASVIHYGGQSSSYSMDLQKLVSFGLTWYKKGWGLYTLFLSSLIFNSLTELLVCPFMRAENRLKVMKGLSNVPRALFVMLFDIPSYKRKWGSRPAPLKVI